MGSAVTNPGSGNVGALLKTGAGTTILNTNQNFTGTTTVSGGALELATGGQLSGSSALVVNTGGTLLLSGTGGTNSKLRTTATTDLHGGTLALTGLTSHLDQQLGTLTLSENSTLDFGTFAAGQTLRFADSSASLWTSGKTLSIWNWSQGTDHLSFGTSNLGLTSTQLSSLRFYSDSGSTLIPGGAFAGSSGTFGEVSPIPEPSSLPPHRLRSPFPHRPPRTQGATAEFTPTVRLTRRFQGNGVSANARDRRARGRGDLLP